MHLRAQGFPFSPLLPHLLHNFCNFSFLLTKISMTVANKSLSLKHAAEISIKLELPKLVFKYTYHLYANTHITFMLCVSAFETEINSVVKSSEEYCNDPFSQILPLELPSTELLQSSVP